MNILPTPGHKKERDLFCLFYCPHWLQDALSARAGRAQRVWLRPGPLSLKNPSWLRNPDFPQLLSTVRPGPGPQDRARPYRDLSLPLEAPASLSGDCFILLLPWGPFIALIFTPVGWGIQPGSGLRHSESSGPDGVQRGTKSGRMGL